MPKGSSSKREDFSWTFIDRFLFPFALYRVIYEVTTWDNCLSKKLIIIESLKMSWLRSVLKSEGHGATVTNWCVIYSYELNKSCCTQADICKWKCHQILCSWTSKKKFSWIPWSKGSLWRFWRPYANVAHDRMEQFNLNWTGKAT